MYTKEEEQYLIEHYDGSNVEKLAKALNKTPRSIIGKLSRLKIYQKKQYLNKLGERPVTKLEYCARIAQSVSLDPEELEGLSKAPKSVLIKLVSKLEEPDA